MSLSLAARNAEARRNAAIAVEVDPVRRADHLADLRLAAAVMLAPCVIACEALLAGIPAPADRLDRAWVRVLHLQGDVVLEEELALRVVAHGPLRARESRRLGAA